MDTATNDIQWRILSGKSRYPEHLPLLSRAATIFRVSFLLLGLSTSWNHFLTSQSIKRTLNKSLNLWGLHITVLQLDIYVLKFMVKLILHGTEAMSVKVEFCFATWVIQVAIMVWHFYPICQIPKYRTVRPVFSLELSINLQKFCSFGQSSVIIDNWTVLRLTPQDASSLVNHHVSWAQETLTEWPFWSATT